MGEYVGLYINDEDKRMDLQCIGLHLWGIWMFMDDMLELKVLVEFVLHCIHYTQN